MGETALVIEVPEAESVVSDWRRKHDPVAVLGMPGHVTALFPFVPPEEFDDDVLEALTSVAQVTSWFDYELTQVDQFPGAVWLRPTQDQSFQDFTRRLWTAFPEYPPYGGRFPDSQPHLTLCVTTDPVEQADVALRISDDLARHLPIRCLADALSVFQTDADGVWSRKHRIELAR